MPKTKEKSSAEYYRKLIRTLQKQLRQLEKEVTYLRKRAHIQNEVEDTAEEEIVVVEDVVKHPICDDCGKGQLFPKLEFETKVIRECTHCGYRKSTLK